MKLPRKRPNAAIEGYAMTDFNENESGQALIEFALFASLFIVFLIGVTNISVYIMDAMIVQSAATEGANYGAAPGNQLDTSGMTLWANQASTGANLSALPSATTFFTCSPGGTEVTSSTVCSGGGAPMEYVKVTTTGTISPLLKSKIFSMLTVSGTAIYRVAWKTQ